MNIARSTEVSGFLDGREYTASFLYEFCALIVGNGVYANELAPTATNDNMTITHGSGHAWINGVLYKNTTPFNLDIDAADGALNRYDSLMLRLDLSQNEAYAVIEKGTFAASPIPPGVTRNAETFDLKICDIYIPAGCTKITQDLITDTRLDDSVCGVPVFPVEHLDMTTFYRQVATDLDNLRNKEQQEILELLKQLNNLVEGDTAGKLIAEIGKRLLKDGSEPMNGDMKMNSHRITGLGDPKENSDAVNKRYVSENYIPASHATDKNNPHGVTAEQIGARPNTWTPSAAEVGATPASHATDKNNPHGVTVEQIGALPSSKIIAVAKTITFTDGIGTYKNSAIASGAIAFAQFRAGQVSTLADSVLGVYPNAGSVTIISKMGQSGALPVLILVINP